MYSTLMKFDYDATYLNLNLSQGFFFWGGEGAKANLWGSVPPHPHPSHPSHPLLVKTNVIGHLMLVTHA